MDKLRSFTHTIFIKSLFAGFNLFFLLANVSAQSPVIKTTIDKTNVLIGEHIKYSVEASFPVGTYQFNWLNIPDSIQHFEVVKRGKIDTTEADGIINVKQQITLTSFDSGVNTLPSFIVNFDPLVDDTTINLFTDSFLINVSFSPMDSSKTFHDIKSIIEVKDEKSIWIWVTIAILILLLALIIYYLVKHYNQKKEVSLFNAKLSPLEEALEALQQLQREHVVKNDIKHFHIKLSEIFKRYISRKLNRNMLNMTSSEILVSLNTVLYNNDISLLANSLRMNDAVKFAKFLPASAESEKALNDIRNIIEQQDRLIINNS